MNTNEIVGYGITVACVLLVFIDVFSTFTVTAEHYTVLTGLVTIILGARQYQQGATTTSDTNDTNNK